jgi:predicted ATPase
MYVKKIIVDPADFPREDVYPFNVSVFQKPLEVELTKRVSIFVGENGSGKSTLLEAIARKCGIYIWQGDTRERYSKSPYEKMLHRYVRIELADHRGTNNRQTGPREIVGSFFASEIFKNFSQILDEWAASDPGILEFFGSKSLMNQSHGQGHLSFFRSRFSRGGLFLLDEPENALSPNSQLELLRILKEAGKDDSSQFIIATHSPIILACPGAQLLNFNGTTVEETAYEETDHFKLYRDFLNDRERFF